MSEDFAAISTKKKNVWFMKDVVELNTVWEVRGGSNWDNLKESRLQWFSCEQNVTLGFCNMGLENTGYVMPY